MSSHPLKTTLVHLAMPGKSFALLLAGLMFFVLLGLGAFWTMEHHGHIITGMNNQIVWGVPHVFAVFLVVAASGALNVASMASVFGKTEFKPLAPLSGLLAIALLIGGLAVLTLDLGRPDRLIVAMTHFNFKSIFTWNVFFYTGFIGFIAVYLWTMMEPKMNRHTSLAGLLTFVWRMTLTTATGSIFGFLVARSAYDSALMAPLFIALSLSYGFAIFVLVLLAVTQSSGQSVSDTLLARFARLQIIFVAAGLYFVLVYHLTNFYFTKHQDVERFLLVEGGIFTILFWLVQVLLGGILPMLLLKTATTGNLRQRLIISAALVILGGFAQMYVTIIGGQALPLSIFPGYEVSSSFFDGVINHYSPSLPEWLLGTSGLAITGLILAIALRVMRFLPQRVDDAALGLSETAA